MAGIFFKQYRYYIVILAGVVAGTLLANLAIDNVTDKIGIFNPRLNNVYTLNVDTIPRETINNVKKVVIGIDY